VSTLNRVNDPVPLSLAVFASNTAGSPETQILNMRHELVDAQVEVLRMYLEKKPEPHLLDALDRLIECTRASFRQEEDLMTCLGCLPDHAHREMHQTVLAELELLRSCLMEYDRARLLAQLIMVDRQLTSHLSDAVRAPLIRQHARLAESEPSRDATAEYPAHH